MPEVVGVRFKPCGKIYDFEVEDTGIELENLVVIESNFGVMIGKIAIGRHTVEDPEKPLKKVLRVATVDDMASKADNDSLRRTALSFCKERVVARDLPMKLIETEVTLDKKRILFYFTANGRIDFRELVKDLAARFKTRIEMRQIGVRDEAKIVGGLGVCGREACCRTFLSDFAPISIKMAKDQEIALNPGKLSGLCGRLMCCIGFEPFEGDLAYEGGEAGVTIVEDTAISEAVEVKPKRIESKVSIDVLDSYSPDDFKYPVIQSAEGEAASDNKPKKSHRHHRRGGKKHHSERPQEQSQQPAAAVSSPKAVSVPKEGDANKEQPKKYRRFRKKKQ